MKTLWNIIDDGENLHWLRVINEYNQRYYTWMLFGAGLFFRGNEFDLFQQFF